MRIGEGALPRASHHDEGPGGVPALATENLAEQTGRSRSKDASGVATDATRHTGRAAKKGTSSDAGRGQAATGMEDPALSAFPGADPSGVPAGHRGHAVPVSRETAALAVCGAVWCRSVSICALARSSPQARGATFPPLHPDRLQHAHNSCLPPNTKGGACAPPNHTA